MRLILGIGNPGARYQNNRHNVGFIFLDYLANKYAISFFPSRNDYYFAEHIIGANQFCLIKPSNYVNNSGISAKLAIHHYNASIDDLLVICDDVYLPLGNFRLKLTGGNGGHKGINSIIYHLFTEDFLRIRIGVGSKDFLQEKIAEFVLSNFSCEEEGLLERIFTNCFPLTEAFILGGKKHLLDANSKIIKPKGSEI